MRGTCGLVLSFLLFSVVLPPALAVDTFVYDGRFGGPGLRLVAPFLTLANGDCWSYAWGNPPHRGTPETGVTGRLPWSTNWPTDWIGAAGNGAWGYTYWADSYGYYSGSGTRSAQVFCPWVYGTTWGRAVGPDGSLTLVAWNGSEPSSARRYASSGAEVWDGDLPAAGTGMGAVAICADSSGFFSLFESADHTRHAVVRYDLSAPTAIASVVADVTDDGRPFQATGFAVSPSATPNTFLLCGDATDAGLGMNAVFALGPGGLALVIDNVGEGLSGRMERDAYRNRVWVFGGDAFGYVDNTLTYYRAGTYSFDTPAEYLAQPFGIAAGGSRVVVGDLLNRSATMWSSPSTGSVFQFPGQWALVGALSADGDRLYMSRPSDVVRYQFSTATLDRLYDGCSGRPVLGGGKVWIVVADAWRKASVVALDAASGAEQKRWGTDVSVDELKDIGVSPDGSRVALGYDGGDPFVGATLVLFSGDGAELTRIKLPSFYKLESLAFGGNDQIVALVRLASDESSPEELLGYDLTGTSLWRTTVPSGVARNPYADTVPPEGGPWPHFPRLAVNEMGNTLLVADRRQGVVHRFVRQTQAAAITEVMPGASLRQRAVTVHVWGHGLPTSGTVVLRKTGAADIALTDVTFDGQAHLWGIANLTSASGGWYDLVINPGAGEIRAANAMMVAADYPPATLMGTWRLNAWGPPGSLTTMYEDRLLMFLDEQGSYAWDRPDGGEGSVNAWAGKAAAYGDKLAMLNLSGLKRSRLAFVVNRDQLTLTQETGDGAPLVFEFTRRDEKTILGDEHVGAWKLIRYDGVLPASSTPTWNQTMAIYRDGSCRIESDRSSGSWWRSGSLLVPGVTNGPAVFRTKAASTGSWAGQVWVGTWQWGTTHSELVFSWLDESGRVWQETWQRTGGAPDVPVLAVRLTGPPKITGGGAGTYTVSCENLGAVSAKSLTISLTVPWLNGGNPIALETVTELVPGAKRTVPYMVSCPAGIATGPYVFTASADWTLPQVAQEKATLNVTVVPPQLDIAMSETGPVICRPMEPFRWILRLANHGSDLSLVVPPAWDSQVAVYKDYDLATGFAITAWPTDGAHTGYSWTLTWADLKRLIPHSGDSVTLRFTLMADATARPHTFATNVVAVRPVDPVAVPDVHPSDNADGVRTEVITAWDPNAIYVRPVGLPGLAADETSPGGRLHYTVTFENEGTDDARMVQVDVVFNPLLNLDTLSWETPEGLPAGATVDVTLDRDARRLRWVFNNLALAPGGEGQVQFGVNVRSDVDFGGAESVTVSQAAKIYFDFAIEERAQMTEPPATVRVVKPVGDVNGDGLVNLADLRAFIGEWRRGADPYMARLEGSKVINADLNLNGRIDHDDAQRLLEKLRRQGDLP